MAGLSGNKASGMFFEWNSLHHAPIRRFCGKIPYNIKKNGIVVAKIDSAASAFIPKKGAPASRQFKNIGRLHTSNIKTRQGHLFQPTTLQVNLQP